MAVRIVFLVKSENKQKDRWWRSFMQRPVHPSFGWIKPLWTGRNMDGEVNKMKEQKRCSKTYCHLSVIP